MAKPFQNLVLAGSSLLVLSGCAGSKPPALDEASVRPAQPVSSAKQAEGPSKNVPKIVWNGVSKLSDQFRPFRDHESESQGIQKNMMEYAELLPMGDTPQEKADYKKTIEQTAKNPRMQSVGQGIGVLGDAVNIGAMISGPVGWGINNVKDVIFGGSSALIGDAKQYIFGIEDPEAKGSRTVAFVVNAGQNIANIPSGLWGLADGAVQTMANLFSAGEEKPASEEKVEPPSAPRQATSPHRASIKLAQANLSADSASVPETVRAPSPMKTPRMHGPGF